MKSSIGLALTLLRQKSDPAEVVLKLALRKTLLGCENVLDVGCGASLTMRQLGVSHATGIDGYKPSVDQARKINSHDEMIHGDVRELDRYFRPKQFDACVALDVIEHLVKDDGIKLMRNMEKIAAKRIVFLTPSGFLPQKHSANDDLQEHLSGWETSEMTSYGYQVTGLLGPKKLRGEYHALKGRPRVFWGMVSLLGHFICTRNHPEKAAAILCVKDLTGD